MTLLQLIGVNYGNLINISQFRQRYKAAQACLRIKHMNSAISADCSAIVQAGDMPMKGLSDITVVAIKFQAPQKAVDAENIVSHVPQQSTIHGIKNIKPAFMQFQAMRKPALLYRYLRISWVCLLISITPPSYKP